MSALYPVVRRLLFRIDAERAHGAALRAAEVHLVDDRQHRDLEQDRVQPRSLDDDADLARARLRFPIEGLRGEAVDWRLTETPALRVVRRPACAGSDAGR